MENFWCCWWWADLYKFLRLISLLLSRKNNCILFRSSGSPSKAFSECLFVSRSTVKGVSISLYPETVSLSLSFSFWNLSLSRLFISIFCHKTIGFFAYIIFFVLNITSEIFETTIVHMHFQTLLDEVFRIFSGRKSWLVSIRQYKHASVDPVSAKLYKWAFSSNFRHSELFKLLMQVFFKCIKFGPRVIDCFSFRANWPWKMLEVCIL